MPVQKPKPLVHDGSKRQYTIHAAGMDAGERGNDVGVSPCTFIGRKWEQKCLFITVS